MTGSTKFVIFNANGLRWGSETYPSERAAKDELREFWKGVAGVKLGRFIIAECPADQAESVRRFDFKARASS